jgi:hypothetical protein
MATTPDPALEAARARVVRLLTDRVADDTLTVEQFEARLDRMHALATPAALDAMAEELERAAAAPQQAAPYQAAPYPAAPYYQGQGYPVAAATAPIPAAGWAPDARAARPAPPAEGRVLAVMSTARRAGGWLVPRRLQAMAVMGEVVLDLRAADLTADCEIEVFALMGNVRVILPFGTDARVEVDAFMGSADDRTRGRGYAAGHGPRVRVTGLAVMSEVRVVDG